MPSPIEMVIADAMDFLQDKLQPQTDAWIIPAVPVHLAYEWLAGQLKRTRGLQPQIVPRRLWPALPNPCGGTDGQVYLSNANFRCPGDCPEPKTACSHTGKPRPLVMHTYLSTLEFEDYISHVIQSIQLAPGVGGFHAATLWSLLNKMRCQNGNFLLSTACKCHAVMNAFFLP